MQDYLQEGEVLLGDVADRVELKDDGNNLTISFFLKEDNLIPMATRTVKKIVLSTEKTTYYTFPDGVWIAY